MSKISLNASALELVKRLCSEADRYGVAVEETESGATLVDAGLKAEGGFLAGEVVTEICLGGYGRATAIPVQYGDMVLPSVFVQTDHPALSLLGSQFVRLAGGHALISANLTYSSGTTNVVSGTGTPEDTVKSFYGFIGKGLYANAWEISVEPDWRRR
jgi:methenyltetrahydromethanopterin cyclohydrolase